jgi:DNA-binding MarR family transcriptional regulator
VVFGGPLSLGALATAEQVRPPTMSRVVGALEAAGLVTREADPTDARAILVTATRPGRRLLAEGRRRRVEALAERLRALDDDERAALHAAAPALVRVSGAPARLTA